jgi:hypothetical protein
MNAKLLFAATVAISLASTLAMAADQSPLTREQVVSELNQAAADGTLQKTDYDYARGDGAAVSSKTREQVASELAASKQPNPLIVSLSDKSRNYNPFGTELKRPSVVDRAQVKAEVVQALRDGSLPRTDYEYDQAFVARRIGNHTAAPTFAQGKSATQAGY